MRKQFIIFLVFFNLCCYTFLAQSDCNCPLEKSYKNSLNASVDKVDEDSLIYFVNQLKKSNCELSAIKWQLQFYLKNNNLDTIPLFLSELKNKAAKNNCTNDINEYHYFKGNYFTKTEQFDSATHYFLKCISEAKATNDIAMLAKSNLNFAMVFAKTVQPIKAVMYDKIALNYAQQINDVKLILQCSVNLQSDFGTCFDLTENALYLDSARLQCVKSLQLAKLNKSKKEIIRSYVTLAGIYLMEKKYQTSLAYGDSVLAIASVKSHKNSVFSIYNKMTRCYIDLKNPSKALALNDSALKYKISQANLADVFYNYVDIYKQTNNFEKALFYNEKVKVLEEERLNTERLEAVTDLEEKYNKAQNEKTIKELNQDAEIKNLRIRSLIFVVVLIVLILLLIVFFFRQKSIKNKQTIIETEQRLNRARINPHFFFNALTTLQGLAVRENDGKKVAINLYKFSSLMRKTLESSYNDYITIEKELEFIKQYIELQNLKESNKFDYVVNVDENINQTEVLIPSMLIQPFLENAIEHGFSDIDFRGLLQLTIHIKDKNLVVVISDNGKGINTSENKNSNHISRAIQITKDRLYLINKEKNTNCSYTVSNNAPHGVIVELVLPLL
jgi:tetratricopeptide (TPR) repeat protein